MLEISCPWASEEGTDAFDQNEVHDVIVLNQNHIDSLVFCVRRLRDFQRVEMPRGAIFIVTNHINSNTELIKIRI